MRDWWSLRLSCCTPSRTRANVLTTAKNGLLFIDLETCCRGPVEFDLAHSPEEVGEHYPGVNQGLLRDCRILVLAMITTWHWDRGDQSQTGASSAQTGSSRSEQRSNGMGWTPMADPPASEISLWWRS
jgi:thiamine kinase-like enzyme